MGNGTSCLWRVLFLALPRATLPSIDVPSFDGGGEPFPSSDPEVCLQRKVGQPGVRARPVSVCQMESTAREVCLVIGNNELLYRSQFLGFFPL